MADSVTIPGAAITQVTADAKPVRHALLVRITHWLTAISAFALLLTGGEIVLSHPRFYWGETGDDYTRALFQLPVPSSRDMVPTGYHYVLPDQNGWSRALHFQAAWLLVFTGLLYIAWGLFSGHFRRNLLPLASRAKWRAAIADHLRFRRPHPSEAHNYNPLQRLAYSAVVFGLVPLTIWSGLALSHTFDAILPITVNALGGFQSARTIHFFCAIALTLFILIHLAMIVRAGFLRLTRAMITGRAQDQP
jgi:thiosulfate reductase cytochrome b subunit